MKTIYPSIQAAIEALQSRGFLLVADLPKSVKLERRGGRCVVTL
ncbi:hypothetical protein [Pseudomonas sp. 5P_3.1_Bac2]|nr:hypothetical protein [Pseudomonas sp. 5P_3.1_Bac2]MCU1717348.1 hypothetical protein [Pseudomonas sp. 5P_3.1_Bac2]